jgi:hypothetical protein
MIYKIILILYFLAYAGMILYDLFLAKGAEELAPVVEEEEIDITEEMQTFQPVEVVKDEPEARQGHGADDADHGQGEAPDTAATGDNVYTGRMKVTVLCQQLEAVSQHDLDAEKIEFFLAQTERYSRM